MAGSSDRLPEESLAARSTRFAKGKTFSLEPLCTMCIAFQWRPRKDTVTDMSMVEVEVRCSGGVCIGMCNGIVG